MNGFQQICELDQIQRWMQQVITHPDGVRAGIVDPETTKIIRVGVDNLDRVIGPSSQMTSLDRLQIYGRAYFSRLIECLQAQFPAVCHAVGDDAFGGLAYGYLSQHRSRDFTLATLGESFSSFLSETRPARLEGEQWDFADFLIELAELERVYADVFCGRGPEMDESLSPARFEGLAAEDFSRCRFVPHACVRLLVFHFPVHEFASAIRKGIDPPLPVMRETRLVVTRRDYVVRRYELSETQYALLTSLVRGDAIGQALGQLLETPHGATDSFIEQVRTWFCEWSAAPLFRDLVPA